MRFHDIRRHLIPYTIKSKRTTTINHAFASAIAPHDEFDEKLMREAIRDLGQDPETDLTCAYCGKPSETWDHVYGTVQKTEFSGYGHRVGNLLPCCKRCNSIKGNREWSEYLERLNLPSQIFVERKAIITNFLSKYLKKDEVPRHFSEYQALQGLRKQILDLFGKADELAAKIRAKARASNTHLNLEL